MFRQAGRSSGKRRVAIALGVMALALASMRSVAATKTVDLDGQSANGAESKCDLNVLSSFPVQVENVVTNKAISDAFDFTWKSAGPGGFTSSAAPGTAGGVGAKWTWSTNQSVYSYTGSTCEKDICFLKTSGLDPLPGTCSLSCVQDGITLTAARGATGGGVDLAWSGGTAGYTVYRSATAQYLADPVNAVTTTSLLQYADTPPAGGVYYYLVRGTNCTTRKACASASECHPASEGTCSSRGPFSVPGRSLSASDITVSSASLTSSLITFFSPPKEIFRVTSVAQPGVVTETVTNGSTQPVTVETEAYPPGCCPADPNVPNLLRCGDACVDYLNDPNNCGACGNVCGDGACCSNGNCVSLCPDGWTWCDGQCVDLRNDSANCGTCGNVCGEGTCCQDGACVSLCAPGDLWCNWQCADDEDDSGNCGGCGVVCADGTCCDDGACASLCAPGWTWCNGSCADLRNDNENCGTCGNACGADQCCNAGACASLCEAGRTLCGELCYDLQNDPGNCGACGNVCPEDSVCAGGACVPCSGQGGRKDACDNRCVNLNTDPYNCGACGHSCNLDCPSGFTGVCSNGQSCRCVEGTPAPQPPSNIPPPTVPVCPNPTPVPGPVPGVCPNPDPSPGPVPGTCPNPATTSPIPGVCPVPGPPAPPVEPTPICQINPGTETIPAGGSSTTCRPGGLLFREVASTVSVCGDSIPGPDGRCNDGISNVSTGTFNRLVPDTETPIGDAFLTPYAVHVTDTSNDGLIQPGEAVSFLVDVVNAGPKAITGASAVLSSPPVDLTEDGLSNPLGASITAGTSSYGTIAGTLPAVDCNPVVLHPGTNAVPFQVTLPPDHPGDVSRPFRLQFSGTVDGAPYAKEMTFVIGVADRCDFNAATRDYDGLDGLLSPMVRLVPVGDGVPFPDKPFNAGQTRPLKLRMLCGGVNLRGADVDAAEIVGLSEATRGVLDISVLNLNDDTGTPDPYFRWNDSTQQWIFNLRTTDLGPGVYTLKIRIAGRKDYVTGFQLR